MLKVTLALSSCSCSLSAINQDRYDLPDTGSRPQTTNLRQLEKQERELRMAREKRDLAKDAETLADLSNPKSKVKAKEPPEEDAEPEAGSGEEEEAEEEEVSEDDM